MAIDIGLGELVGSQSPDWIAPIRRVLPGDGGVEAAQQDLGSSRSRGVRQEENVRSTTEPAKAFVAGEPSACGWICCL
jgi:hypothetical protein